MKIAALFLAALALLLFSGQVFVLAAEVGPLTEKDVALDGWKLTITSLGQSVDVEPLSLKSYTHTAELKSGTPGWRGPLLLPGPAWAYRALHEETLKATLADDPSTTLQAGKDFALDPKWAAVAAIEGSRYPAGTKVKFEYKYGMSRVDLLELTPQGKLLLIKGQEDKGQPRMPAATPGNRPLAGIYLPNHARKLTAEMVCLIDPDYDGTPPVMGREHLEPIRARLKAGQGTTIVFFGDSITAQQMKDFRDHKGSFVDRFVDYMKQSYPEAEVILTPAATAVESKAGRIVIVKAGVGGNNTSDALKRLERDILPHKSDLVVIMFGVNDENRKTDGVNVIPVAQYKENLGKIVDRLRQAGSESLIMTTSMKNRGWIGTVGNLDKYAAAARQVAAEKKVCLVDNFAAWEQLSRRGYHYMLLLGNCINHPVDIGHDVFIRGLKAAFDQAPAGEGTK